MTGRTPESRPVRRSLSRLCCMQPNHSSTHSSISEESRPYRTDSSVTDRPQRRNSSVAPRLLSSGFTTQYKKQKRDDGAQALQRAAAPAVHP